MLRRHWPHYALVALLTLLLGAPATARQPASTAGTQIAYVSPSRENRQIRTIAPDGSGDRVVWAAPAETTREDGVGTLSWRPDGAELAFDSSHDGLRSLLVRDLYGVRPNGTNLRRITAPPGPLNTGGLQTGTVTLRVENYAGGKELSVYLDGAPNHVAFTAPESTAWVITFTNVPDLGPGIRQYARVLNRSESPLTFQCWFDPAAYADVQPGQVVQAGQLTSLQNTNCPYAFAPAWNADGTALNYLYRDASRSIDRPNNIWQVSAEAAPTTIGDLLLDMNQFVTSDRLYLLAHGPAPSQSDQLVFVQNGATITPIYRGTVADLATAGRVDTGRCLRTICKVLGLAWLPDGSGFVFSQFERGTALSPAPPAGGALYRYDFASQRVSEILRLPDEVIGRLTVAPDGGTIAFERAARLDESVPTVTLGPSALCPCSIWLVGTDGSGGRQLVADGRAPAWSQTAPPAFAPLTPRLWLPDLRE
jgi:hypothetical protein